jgi:hypothetical protein
VQSSTFGGEFGHITKDVLRSGANDLRATVFEFMRNPNFDANNFYANRAVRDKTFLCHFAGFRQREGVSTNGLYPSVAQLFGDLSDDSAGRPGRWQTSKGVALGTKRE